jgi:hypothetical protein
MKQAIIRIAAFGLSALAITATIAAPANAQTAPAFVDFTFSGTVIRSANNTILARNPDGSTTTLSGTQIPEYRYNPGDQLTTTFRFQTDQPAFSNASCGGRFNLGTAGQNAGNACAVELSSVNTPFGRVGFGGLGGDAFGSVGGLDLVRDASGNYSIDMPTGTYTMRYVGVNPYYYDSATGQLLPPNTNVCVDAFSCPTGVITGNATGWTADIPIAGDFGLVRPGLNVGYNAGSAGTFSLGGLFSFGNSSGGPVDVPEPASLLFFGAGAAALAARRRRAKKAWA